MGMFSYECAYCGGGEQRCGSDHFACGCGRDCDFQFVKKITCPNVIPCDGGQLCWEDKCVIFPLDKQIQIPGIRPYDGPPIICIYDGYGYVKPIQCATRSGFDSGTWLLLDDVEGGEIYPIQFSEFFDTWFGDTQQEQPIVCGDIVCFSCWGRMNNQNKKKRQ